MITQPSPTSTYFVFFSFVRKFVFQTAHWRDGARGGVGGAPTLSKSTLKRGISTSELSPSPRGVGSFGSFAEPGLPEESKSVSMGEEKEAADFVLVKSRPNKNFVFVPFADSEEYGVHFNEKGECADKGLLNLMVSIAKTLNLARFEADLHKDIEPDAKTFLMRMEAETQFMEDSMALVSVIHKIGITQKKITWRYLANVTMRHVTAPAASARRGLAEEVSSIMSGEKQMGGLSARLTSALTLTGAQSSTVSGPEGILASH